MMAAASGGLSSEDETYVCDPSGENPTAVGVGARDESVLLTYSRDGEVRRSETWRMDGFEVRGLEAEGETPLEEDEATGWARCNGDFSFS